MEQEFGRKTLGEAVRCNQLVASDNQSLMQKIEDRPELQGKYGVYHRSCKLYGDEPAVLCNY